MHMQTRAHTHTHHTCLDVCVHTSHTHVHMCAHTCTDTYTTQTCLDVCVHTCTHTYAQVHIPYTCARVYVYPHYTHICAHTHMPRYTPHTHALVHTLYTHVCVHTLHSHMCVYITHVCLCTHVHVYACTCSHVHTITRVHAHIFTYILFSTRSHAHQSAHPPCQDGLAWPSGPAAATPHGRSTLPPHHAGQGCPPHVFSRWAISSRLLPRAGATVPAPLQQTPQATSLLSPPQHSQDPPQLAGQRLLPAAQEQSGCPCLCQNVLAVFGGPSTAPSSHPQGPSPVGVRTPPSLPPCSGPRVQPPALPLEVPQPWGLSISSPAVCLKAGHCTSLGLNGHSLAQGRWILPRLCTRPRPNHSCRRTGRSGLPAGGLCPACGREVVAPL